MLAYSVTSVVSDSLQPYGLKPTRLLCSWDSPGKNTGVDFHALLQGSSQPRDRTHISHLSFTTSITWEALEYSSIEIMVKKEKRKLLESQVTEYINGI